MARRHPAATSAKRRAAPPNPSPPPPPADGSLPLLHAASCGDLRLFKRLVRDLDQGRGRPREVVEAAKDQGLVALHFAAGKGRPRVCRYLVDELGVDVDAVDNGELGYRKLYVDQHQFIFQNKPGIPPCPASSPALVAACSTGGSTHGAAMS